MTKIGSLLLRHNPVVAAIVDRHIPLKVLRDLKCRGVELLELRIDLIAEGINETMAYLHEIKTELSLPAIGTIRENAQNKSSRLELFQKIMPYVDCVDIELGSSIAPALIDSAKGKTIIVSEHDFEKTPEQSVLARIVEQACDQGANIVKIAVMAQNSHDVTRLLRFTEECSVPIVAIAMGPIGTISRVIAPLFGSLFTFGFVGESVAPGQLSVEKLIEEINLYYPRMSS